LEEKFKSSAEIFAWLEQFINLERGQKPKSFRLDRMEFLAELAGNPQRCAPAIHVAGSKGKGSVTAMITAMLGAAGYRAARYMSPHVVNIRERICIGDSYFSEEIYAGAGNELREITEERLPAAIKKQPQAAALFSSATVDGCEPTYFELLTLFFFLCAKHGNCDVMVVETGMGGRLDSTNILNPLASVITLIELEHTGFLGNTIEKIAEEKAGIIKKGRPLILAKQCEEALQIFIKKAKEKNSPLLYYPVIAEISNITITANGTNFTLSLKKPALDPIFLSVPIPGKVQAENAALAIAVVKTAFPHIFEVQSDAIHKGLKSVKLPARFETLTAAPPFIIDGAHTPESLQLCVETFSSLYGSGGILLFGCAIDKDAHTMAQIACQYFAKIIITTAGNFKPGNPGETYETFIKQAGKEKIKLVPDTREAVRQTKELSENMNLPVLATGSFYLAAEIRGIINEG
jgi:dihydrofolate synthase/folylpolyglutamate synthase